MNKNVIKKFAMEARRDLISRVSQRALKYGISEQEVGNPNDDSAGGYLFSPTEKIQRAALIAQIKAKGYEQVMEEVAYTWFNRFCALRFMEVNGYLPSRVRVFTDENNTFKPQILTEAIHLELDDLNMEKVYAYKEANANDELYKYLLITQCNALSSLLPGMFQKISDYTELLFPDNLLREGSVIQQMIELIPEEDWQDQVQIIGWLYQYYNSEKKDEVFADLKKNIKITKEKIPAVTQLFTPDWIVRYMVENSLGRLWLEGHPNDELKSKWKYYLEEAEQKPEVQEKLEEIRKESATLTPDQLKVIDPCSGSGHILAYIFDVLMQIYESYGYTTREAVASIVKNNIFGLDIDERAAQLAYFAVMMKARQYDSRFLSRGIQPNVYAIVESNPIDSNTVDYFCNGDVKLKKAVKNIISELHDAKEYGSILTVTPQDWSHMYNRFAEIEKDTYASRKMVLEELLPLVQVAEVLAQKYDVVVTNPPYMGSSSASAKLSSYVKKYYPDSKSDMFAVFIERCGQMNKKNGYYAMITMHSWMFLPSFEGLRTKLFNDNLINMAHLGTRAFEDISGEVVQTTTFVYRKLYINNYLSSFSRLVDYLSQTEKDSQFKNADNVHTKTQDLFCQLPSKIFAYWISNNTYKAFTECGTVSDFGDARQGMATGNNEKFVRYWYEPNFVDIGFGYKSYEEFKKDGHKYVPYTKSAGICRWYGNYLNILKFDAQNYEMLSHSGNCLPSRQYYFRENANWSLISTGRFGARYAFAGSVFDVGAHAYYGSNGVIRMLGYLNSCVFEHFIKFLSPTINYNSGIVAKVPAKQIPSEVEEVSTKNIDIAKENWDSFETSWGFQRHPLLRKVPTIAESFDQWQAECDERFTTLKLNEEELNRIFIDIYGLQDELTPDVEDKDVTVRKADLERDIKSFISYAVGCIFGRYSLDVDGLAYAGGEWDSSKYKTFKADKDNIIPICDDEYFDDDIVGRIVDFVRVVYGAETLEENLKFIAEALGGKGQPKEVIRKYFLNNFYKDHCKTYQKRPIYWLFDSGKKNGFKALIYMHRYEPDTIARIRTDYVHEQQGRYNTEIADLEARLEHASTAEGVKLNRQIMKLKDQATELHEYEEKIHHMADKMISIDLDDGVKVNYAKFKDVLAKIK